MISKKRITQQVETVERLKQLYLSINFVSIHNKTKAAIIPSTPEQNDQLSKKNSN